MNNLASFEQLTQVTGLSPLLLGSIMVVVAIWTIYWKAQALWTSARRTHKIWFIVFVIVNTLGILEIAYIYYFADRDESPKN